jgi:hypothetical protein
MFCVLKSDISIEVNNKIKKFFKRTILLQINM